MISKNISKSQFVTQVLRRDIENIYRAQRLIASKNIYVNGKQLKTTKKRGSAVKTKSGELLASLANPNYVIAQQGERFIVSATIVKQLRFMDMKHLGNRKIYNRQVWDILYNNSLRDIKYGYGTEIRDHLKEVLTKALNPSAK